jgi:hypothetical protein
MIAYKFLGMGAVGPFTGFRWPVPPGEEPGPWVDAPGPLEPCRSGVHGCSAAFLPYWINQELWIVELAEPVLNPGSILVAPRGRLLRHVAAWASERHSFAEACARRTRDGAVAFLRDAGWEGQAEELARAGALEEVGHAAERIERQVPDPAATWAAYAADAACYALDDKPHTTAFIAAHAAGFTDPDPAAAFRAERRWQADWLAEQLELDPSLG